MIAIINGEGQNEGCVYRNVGETTYKGYLEREFLHLATSEASSDGEVLYAPWISSFSKDVYNEWYQNTNWKDRRKSTGRSRKINSVFNDLSLK